MNLEGASMANKLEYRERFLTRWLAEVTLDFEPRLPSIFGTHVDGPMENFCGVAWISFPSLRINGKLETRFWCFGCRDFCGVYFLDLNHIPGIERPKVLSRMEYQAQNCSNVQSTSGLIKIDPKLLLDITLLVAATISFSPITVRSLWRP